MYPATPVEVAYVAGLFDGEGSIMVKRQVRATGRGVYYAITIHFALVEGPGADIVQELYGAWGGHYSIRTYNRPNCRPLHRWHLENQSAGKFIALLQPYLRIKLPQSILALELIGLKMARGYRLTDAIYERMEAIDLEMKVLNKRGTTP